MSARNPLTSLFVFAICVTSLAAQKSESIRQDHWERFSFAARGFSASFPASPAANEVQGQDQNEGAHYTYNVRLGNRIFLISVMELHAGQGPQNPDRAFFTHLLGAYVQGSGTSIRRESATKIAGQSCFEAVLDSATLNASSLLDALVVGDRVYIILSRGPKGFDSSADALRFRDSFRLLTQSTAGH